MADSSDVSDLRLANGVTPANAIMLLAGIETMVRCYENDIIGGSPQQNYDRLSKLEIQINQYLKQVFHNHQGVTEIAEIMARIEEFRARKYLPHPSASEIAEIIVRQLDSLVTRLGDPDLVPKGIVNPAGATSTVEDLFVQLTSLLDTSPLRTSISTPEYIDISDIAYCYLQEAMKAYAGKAMVACIVMLGAMLEALMLGTLIRDDLADSVKSYVDGIQDQKLKEKLGGSGHPELKQRIVTRMNFYQYRAAVQVILPPSGEITVTLIQSFRNALHANKALKDRMYLKPDEDWIDNHLRNLVAYVKILNTEPCPTPASPALLS